MAGFPNPVMGNDASQDRANIDRGGQSNLLPTPIAGAQNGGTPPAPVMGANSNDTKGSISFGSGTTPAGGVQVTVGFAKSYDAPPTVIITAVNGSTQALSVFPANTTGAGFQIASNNAPTASQAVGTYSVNYIVIP